jgi:hypothetical protein
MTEPPPVPPDDAPDHASAADPHDVPAWLFGMWRLLRAEAALDFAPGVRMEFLHGGRLRYHIDVGGRDQVIPLVYRVDGDMMRTDNPAAPHAVSTRFALGAGDVLVFDFSGARAWFVRENG